MSLVVQLCFQVFDHLFQSQLIRFGSRVNGQDALTDVPDVGLFDLQDLEPRGVCRQRHLIIGRSRC